MFVESSIVIPEVENTVGGMSIYFTVAELCMGQRKETRKAGYPCKLLERSFTESHLPSWKLLMLAMLKF